jgi:hypothetical protein
MRGSLTLVVASMVWNVWPTRGQSSSTTGARKIDPGTLATEVAQGVGAVGASAVGKSDFATIILFEERHNSRVAQLQEAIAMVRLHERYGLKDVPLEGYLQDGPQLDDGWARKLFGARSSVQRARTLVMLLREGEISSAEFMALMYDDLRLHAVENSNEYNVTASPAAEQAPIVYLYAIAQRSLGPGNEGELRQFQQRIAATPANSQARRAEQKKLIEYILSVDPWVHEKYQLLNDPKRSMALSGEEQQSLAEEIEEHARRSGATIEAADREAMRQYIAFWRGRMGASRTMVENTKRVATGSAVSVVAGPIGAFHTHGMVAMLREARCPFAVITPLAIKNDQTTGDLTDGFDRKYEQRSVFSEGLSRMLEEAFPNAKTPRAKKPEPVLQQEWFQAKAQTYQFTEMIVEKVLAGGAGAPPPPSGPGGGRAAMPPSGRPPGGGGVGVPPYGFSDDDLRGAHVSVDPHSIEVVLAAPGSTRKAVLFPLVFHPDNAAKRRVIWVKASYSREPGDRRGTEDLLQDAIRAV